MANSADENTQPEATSQPAQPAASNVGAQPDASNESAQMQAADTDWMKTESIRATRGPDEGREWRIVISNDDEDSRR